MQISKESIQKVIDGIKKYGKALLPEHYLDAQGKPLTITPELAHQKQQDEGKFENLLLIGITVLDSEGMLPYDMSSNVLDVMDNEQPCIYSYEKVSDTLSVLWDSFHSLDELLSRRIPIPNMIPNRIQIFTKGIKKTRPQVVALELTRDDGQKAVDLYRLGMIDRKVLHERLSGDHMSTSLDDYSQIIDYCKLRDIKIRCVAPNKTDYMRPEEVFTEANPLKEKARAATDTIEQALWELRYIQELTRLQDKVIAPEVLDCVKQGKTLLIMGAGHRPSLLPLLKT